MNRISISYDLKWEFKNHPEYQVTSNGLVFNVKTGRKIKRVVNCRSIGYWIKGKFITINNARNQLIKIKEIETPF